LSCCSLARLVDDRIQTGGANRLTGAAEASSLAKLGEQVTGLVDIAYALLDARVRLH
jgi:hypothetical protein